MINDGDYWWLMLIDADYWWSSLWSSVTWLENAPFVMFVDFPLPRLMTPERIFQINQQKLGLRTDTMKMRDTWYDGDTQKNWDLFFCGISMISTNKNLGVSIWKSWEPFLKIHPLVLIFPMIWWPQFLAKAGEILVGICFPFFDAPLLRYAMKKKGFLADPPIFRA
jgi:hypothetical protein